MTACLSPLGEMRLWRACFAWHGPGLMKAWHRCRAEFSGQVLLATLSVVGTRAMQVYTSAQFARARVRPHALAG